MSWSKQNKGWMAYAKLNYRRVYLGCYATPEEASAVVERWRSEHMPYSKEARDAATAA